MTTTITTGDPHGIRPGQIVIFQGIGEPKNWFKRIAWRAGRLISRIGNMMCAWSTRKRFTIQDVTRTTLFTERPITSAAHTPEEPDAAGKD